MSWYSSKGSQNMWEGSSTWDSHWVSGLKFAQKKCIHYSEKKPRVLFLTSLAYVLLLHLCAKNICTRTRWRATRWHLPRLVRKWDELGVGCWALVWTLTCPLGTCSQAEWRSLSWHCDGLGFWRLVGNFAQPRPQKEPMNLEDTDQHWPLSVSLSATEVLTRACF